MMDAMDQNLLISSGKYENERRYWINKLDDELTPGFFLSNLKNTNGDSLEARILRKVTRFPEYLYQKIWKISDGSEYGIFILLVTGLTCLIHKYAGKDDIIIGMPILKQDKASCYFNEALPLRSIFARGMTFKELLLQIKKTVSEAAGNMNYPLERILEHLDGSNSIQNIYRLFDTMVIFKNIHGESEELIKNPKCSTAFVFNMHDHYIEGELYYPSASIQDTPVQQLWTHLINVLRAGLNEPLLRVADIDLLSPEEKQRILFDFNDTSADYPSDSNLRLLFENRAAKIPASTILEYDGHHVTIGELNKRSNQLARFLQKKGVRSNSVVGIMVQRSIKQITGILAISKAGAAFLPLDHTYPNERLKFMIDDTDVQIVVTETTWLNRLEGWQRLHICLDRDWSAVTEEEDNNIRSELSATKGEDPAYIIYTSGSTGQPKGVLGLHRGVINRCYWMWEKFPFQASDVCCQKTSLNFVDSIWEIFGPLLGGIPLIIISEDIMKNIPAFLRRLQKRNVTRITLVPSLLSKILDKNYDYQTKLAGLKFWIVSGEALNPELLSLFGEHMSDRVLLNLYGSSEISADATCWKAFEDQHNKERIPIGSPIDNFQIYILDRYRSPVPAGIAEEIYIGGAGLSIGYLNQPELTGERFVSVPFIPERSNRVFRSGDRGRYLPDGKIEFQGRIDHQIKIRGFRIEPGEIENRLLEIDLVKEVVVIDRVNMSVEKYLCAYLVLEKKAKLDVEKIKTHLSKKIPDYMIPSHFVQLDNMPLNPNGKIDRRALPEPDIVGVREYLPPETDIEKKLSAMWCEVLGAEKVSVNDDFLRIGGNSLNLMTLLSRIYREFKVEIPVGEIFYNATLRGIACLIEEACKAEYSSINPAEKKDYYPASEFQRAMCIYSELKGSKSVGITYNLPAALIVEGEWRRSKIEAVLQKLVDRHESLRTFFQSVDKQPVQRIKDSVTIRLDYVEVEDNTGMEEIVKNFVKPFELSQAPLMRAQLAKLSRRKDKFLLIFDVHHIISDGQSGSIFIKDFLEFYKGKELKSLPVQFKDFVEWSDKALNRMMLEKQENYWLEVFKDNVPDLNLPLDRARPWMQSFKGANVYFEGDEVLTRKLNEFALEKDVTLFMILLAALYVLLFKYSKDEDTVIGVPIAGRPHPELEQVMGRFVNTLPLRNQSRKDETFKKFLEKVKVNSLQAFDNQDYPFGELVKKLGVKKQLGRNPIFDVLFVLQNTEKIYIDIEGLKFTPYTIIKDSAEFDLTLEADERYEKLFFRLEYCTRIFEKKTAEWMTVNYIQILDSIIENPDIAIDDIQLNIERKE